MFLSVGLSLIFLYQSSLVRGYPSGPPTVACGSMTPNHGADAQSGAGPFSIVASPNTFSPGQEISVTVNSTGDAFRGVFIQARYSKDGEAIGTWEKPTSSNYQHINCGSPTGAIGHTNNNDKNFPQTFLWNVPASPNGDVIFYVTVVHVKEIFYVKIPSNKLVMDTADPTEMMTTTGGASRTSWPLFMLMMSSLLILYYAIYL